MPRYNLPIGLLIALAGLAIMYFGEGWAKLVGAALLIGGTISPAFQKLTTNSRNHFVAFPIPEDPSLDAQDTTVTPSQTTTLGFPISQGPVKKQGAEQDPT